MAHQLAVPFLLIGLSSGILSLILMALSDAKHCSEFTYELIEFFGYVALIFLTVSIVALVFTLHFPHFDR